MGSDPMQPGAIFLMKIYWILANPHKFENKKFSAMSCFLKYATAWAVCTSPIRWPALCRPRLKIALCYPRSRFRGNLWWSCEKCPICTAPNAHCASWTRYGHCWAYCCWRTRTSWLGSWPRKRCGTSRNCKRVESSYA